MRLLLSGPLYDIFEMLLLAIFQLQEEEDDEIREDSDLKTAGKYCQFLNSLVGHIIL